jgi:hypothetical protein
MKKEKKDKKIRFIADCMLGTLAKRLRIFGYDTLYYTKIEDGKLVEIADEQERIILTRDIKLTERKLAKLFIVISSDILDDQVNQIEETCGILLHGKPTLSRCLVCNAELEKAGKKDVIGKVPPFVFLRHRKFTYCLECNKYYWPGTHYKNAETKLKRKED